MKVQRLFFLLIFLFGLMLFAQACGSNSTTFDVEMNEFKFIPDTLTVPAGAAITLNLNNTGALEHEYVIMVMGSDVTLPFDADDEANIYWEKELPTKESATVQFIAPSQPGTYQVVCGTAGHLEQGMKATLIVTP
jgi:plastocyanin